MEGEDEESHDDRAFCNKKPWRRFLIVIMGATFNLILGLVLVAITLIPEKRFTTTTVDVFHENAVSSGYGLQEGDEIIAVDGRKIFTTYDLSYAFSNIGDGAIDITVKRDGKKVELKDVEFASEKVQGMDVLTIDFAVYGQKKTVGSYITNTVKTAASYSVVIWRSLVDLLSGKYGISQVSGPVGVTVALADMAKQNLASLLPMMAFISINLGIFNLLPIPALDGGRLMFILYEMIFRKPVPQKFESLVHTVGFVLLFGFMLLIVAKDILGLIF